MQKTIALIALFGYSMAATGLKNRLAQTTLKQDAPVVAPTSTYTPPAEGGAGSGLDCVCEMPGAEVVGTGFPDMEAGLYTSFSGAATQSTSESVVSVPDTEYTSECESACCACNAAEH